MLLLCALIVGANSWATQKTKWIKTAPANLSAGDVVVIVDVTKSVAIVNNPSSGKSPSATSVTLNDAKDQLSVEGDLDTKFQWTLEAADNNKCRFKVGDNYLFVTTKDDGLRVGTPAEGDVKDFGLTIDEAHDNAEFLGVVMSGTENRYVGVKKKYGSNSWSTPTSINDDIKDTRIAFFKKVVSTKKDTGIKWDCYVEGYATVDIQAASKTYPTLVNPNNLTGIKYSSSNTWVASIDENSGVITLKKRGTVTITATRAEDAGEGDDKYDAANVSYKLYVDDSSSEEGSSEHPFTPSDAIDYVKTNNATDGWVYFVTGRVSKIGSAAGGYAIPGMDTSGSTDGSLTYYISDDGTTGDATKELQISSGKYKLLAPLTDRMITVGDIVTVAGPLVYTSSTQGIGGGIGTGTGGTGSGDKTVKMEAENSIQVHTPVLSSKDAVLNIGVDKPATAYYTLDVAKINGTRGNITITSDKSDIVSYSNYSEKLTANKIGTATITVKVDVTNVNNGEGSYSMESKFQVEVISRDVAPENGGDYQLVTDVSQLNDGDKILIVGTNSDKNYAMNNKQGDSDRGAVEVTVTSDKISEVPTDAQVITLEKNDNNFYFNVGADSYLYASSASADELKSDNKATGGDNAKATISINGSNEATITFQGTTNTHNTIRFDCMSIASYVLSSTFACYTSDYTTSDENTAVLPKIYRFVQANSFTIKTGTTGYKTLVSSLDVDALPDGLKAYIATAQESDNVTIDEVTAIKAGEPYILKGAASTEYTLTKASSSVTAPTGNLLRKSDSSTTNGVYVLATHSGVTGFYKWEGGKLGSGRVYLPASAGAPEFLALDENATGIRSIDNEQLIMDNDNVYNLSGRRVEQPTKGLYIVNGKKVIIK